MIQILLTEAELPMPTGPHTFLLGHDGRLSSAPGEEEYEQEGAHGYDVGAS